MSDSIELPTARSSADARISPNAEEGRSGVFDILATGKGGNAPPVAPFVVKSDLAPLCAGEMQSDRPVVLINYTSL